MKFDEKKDEVCGKPDVGSGDFSPEDRHAKCLDCVIDDLCQ